MFLDNKHSLFNFNADCMLLKGKKVIFATNTSRPNGAEKNFGAHYSFTNSTDHYYCQKFVVSRVIIYWIADTWFVKLKLYMILFISLYDFIWDLYWSQRNQYSAMQHIVPTFSSYEICNDIKYLNLCNYSIFMTCRRILWDVLSLLQ